MDLTTLHFTDALINFTCGAMCLSVWASRPRDLCFALWGSGSLLYGFMAWISDYLPDGAYGIGLSYSALQMATILFWGGYRAFDQRSALPIWLFALPALPLTACLLADCLTGEEMLIAQVIILTYCAVTAAQIIYVLRGCRTWYGPRAISAYAVIFILTSILATSYLTSTRLTKQESEVLLLLTDHAMSIVFTLAVIAMVGQKDLRDLLSVSRRDPLTGALNRGGLTAVLAEGQLGATLILLDLDHFKNINDHYGHDAGDEVLRELVKRTRITIGAKNRVIRMGGEEFLILTDTTDTGLATNLSEQVRQAAREKPVLYGDESISFTISIGFALRGEYEPFMQTLKRADLALYRAKQSGRDCVVDGDSIQGEEIGSPQRVA